MKSQIVKKIEDHKIVNSDQISRTFGLLNSLITKLDNEIQRTNNQSVQKLLAEIALLLCESTRIKELAEQQLHQVHICVVSVFVLQFL